WAGAHIWLATVSLASGRVAGALGPRASLLGCCLLIPVGYAGLALTHVAWGIVFYLCFMTVRGLQAPLLVNVLQQAATAADRAGALSIGALIFRLSFVVIGPPIGLLVDRAGMEAALGVLAVVLGALGLVAFSVFVRADRAGRRD